MDYDEDARKILNVCKYHICVFEQQNVLTKRDYDRIKNLMIMMSNFIL